MQKNEMEQFKSVWIDANRLVNPMYQITDQCLQMLFCNLIEYSLTDVITAVNTCAMSATGISIKPADVLAVLNESSDRHLAIAADEAYELAYSTSCTYCNRSVVFDDPVITQTINEVFLGWQNFCSLKPEYKEADRKRFVAGYLGIINAGHECIRSVMTGDYSGSVKLVRADKTISLTDDQLNRYLSIGEVPKLELVPNETAYVDGLPIIDDPILLAKLRDAKNLDELMGMVLNTERMEAR